MTTEKSELTPLQRVIADAIAECQEFKRSTGRYPDLCTLDEVIISLKSEMLEALRVLYRRKLIVHHSTVNGIPMFGINE